MPSFEALADDRALPSVHECSLQRDVAVYVVLDMLPMTSMKGSKGATVLLPAHRTMHPRSVEGAQRCQSSGRGSKWGRRAVASAFLSCLYLGRRKRGREGGREGRRGGGDQGEIGVWSIRYIVRAVWHKLTRSPVRPRRLGPTCVATQPSYTRSMISVCSTYTLVVVVPDLTIVTTRSSSTTSRDRDGGEKRVFWETRKETGHIDTHTHTHTRAAALDGR